MSIGQDTLPFRIFRLVEMKRNKNPACKTAFLLTLILEPFATFCFVVAAAMGFHNDAILVAADPKS